MVNSKKQIPNSKTDNHIGIWNFFILGFPRIYSLRASHPRAFKAIFVLARVTR